jgi:hypothetical protein
MNAKEATHIRTTLEARKEPLQSSQTTPLCVIVNGECKAKKSRAMEMRFFWLRDRVEQGQFNVTWHSREQNLAEDGATLGNTDGDLVGCRVVGIEVGDLVGEVGDLVEDTDSVFVSQSAELTESQE